MINLAAVNAIFPRVMPASMFEDRGVPTSNVRTVRGAYKHFSKEFKFEVLEAHDNRGDLKKIDIAERFGIEQKQIDHFISQRRRGRI